MKIGYCRVSTEDQNPSLQLDALKSAGCDRIFTDTASGATAKRPELQRCIKSLKNGDTLIVWKLDRLGRSLGDLIKLLDSFKDDGISFQSLTESIDTNTSAGRIAWQIMGALAEWERSLISERTKAGRKAAIARGVKMGRKPILSPQQITHACNLLKKGETPREIMEIFKISPSTFYRDIYKASLQEDNELEFRLNSRPTLHPSGQIKHLWLCPG